MNLCRVPYPKYRACMYLSLVLLAGCATQRTTIDDIAYASNLALLDGNWQVAGKLAIRQQATDNSNASTHTLRFDWQQRADDYEIGLSGTLGFGRISVEKRGDWVSVTRGKNTTRAVDADQLFWQQTGLRLPVSQLRYWAIGLPAPDAAFTLQSEDTDSTGLKAFQQGQWRVSYPQVEPAGRYLLPEKMIASSEQYKLVIALKNWQIETP